MSKLTLLIAATVVATACGKQVTSPPAIPPLDGLYSVQVVNGAALPFVLTAQEELLVRRYALTMTGQTEGTFVQFETVRFEGVDTVSGSNSGTFTLSGTKLTFHYEGTSATDTAVWNGGDQLRLTDGPDVYVLSR